MRRGYPGPHHCRRQILRPKCFGHRRAGHPCGEGIDCSSIRISCNCIRILSISCRMMSSFRFHVTLRQKACITGQRYLPLRGEGKDGVSSQIQPHPRPLLVPTQSVGTQKAWRRGILSCSSVGNHFPQVPSFLLLHIFRSPQGVDHGIGSGEGKRGTAIQQAGEARFLCGRTVFHQLHFTSSGDFSSSRPLSISSMSLSVSNASFSSILLIAKPTCTIT